MAELTVPFHALQHGYRLLKPFASKDDMLPSINAIRIEGDRNVVTMAATDRYALGVLRLDLRSGRDPKEAAEAGSPFEATLDLAGFGRALDALSPRSAGEQSVLDVTIQRTDDYVTLTAGRAGAMSDSLPYPTFLVYNRGDFPKWRGLLDLILEGVGADDVANQVLLDPRQLAKLAPLGGQARLHMNREHKALVATIGETFIGVVMPIRDGSFVNNDLDFWRRELRPTLLEGLRSVETRVRDRKDHGGERDKVSKGRHSEQRKTHCPRGHEYTAENTYITPSRPNNRMCRQCRAENERKRVRSRRRGA